MKWIFSDAKYGDIVRVKLGDIYHYGIYVNNEEIECFIEKDHLIKNLNCKECEEEHFALLEYKLKIISIDLV